MRALVAGVAIAIASVAPAVASSVRVVATTADIAALATAVAGDLVSVESIVPAASDPEAFEPRPRDLDRIRRADVVVRVGLGYDYWLDALINRIGDTRLMRGGDGYVDASTGIPLLEIRGQSVVNEGGHAHGVANPHYWLDPENAVLMSAGIAEALIRLMPGQRDWIIASRERFIAALHAQVQRCNALLAPFAGAKIIAYHNSWPYFARRFRLDVIDFVEPHPGIAPSPSHLAHLISEGRAAHVVSAGSLPAAGTFLDVFDHDCATLANALGASR